MDKQEINRLAYNISTNDWDEKEKIIVGNYEIRQFQGTAFISDYQCFLISKLKENGKGYLPIMVAKITDRNESFMLNLLKSHNYCVPKELCVVSNHTEKIMIFEEYIPGKELYNKSTTYNWRLTARSIARIHERFWNITGKPSHYLDGLPENARAEANRLWEQRIDTCRYVSGFKFEWQEAFKRIEDRMTVCPQTLAHGDFFPTNIIIKGKEPYFIDWENAGEYPYFRDVGRITGIINTETLESFCPDVDCFLKEYYGIVNNMLNVDYEAFLLDIQMGQYIEVANQFTPPKRIGTQIFRDTSMYNEKTERALDGLSRKIIGK